MMDLKNSKRKIVIGVLVLSFFTLGFCKLILNDWTYIDIPEKFSSQFSVNSKKYFYHNKNVYHIQDALPKNFVRDASVDYTSYIQSSLNNHRAVLFPDFPVLINTKGLTVSSNSTLVFNNNSKIKLLANDRSHYEILRIHDVENVVVYGASIIGDKEKHTGTRGEWGMGVSIRGAKNIKLYNTIVTSCWGDGIYLGITEKSSNNVDVTINNTILDNNRRNAMSIIAAENLEVTNLLVANTHGTPPMAGIDIEPDSNTDVIKNLNFDGIISFNNETHGFLFALNNLAGKIPHKEVTINVKNFSAVYGDIGMSFNLGQSHKSVFAPKGLITIDRPRFSKLKRFSFLSYEGNESNSISVHIKTDTVDIRKSQSAFKEAKNILITK